MKFEEIFQLAKMGRKVRRKSWRKGYWCIKDNKIVIHTENNEEINDVFNLETINNIFADDWECVDIQLIDTVNMMLSDDYKERFKAEYYQTKIRYEKLKIMCDKWDKGALKFTPTCSRHIYGLQLESMHDYLTVLESRANIENIDLFKDFNV